MTVAFFELAAELLARREPFATATVVRAERPTSAKPGAKAIITPDGKLTGWIGGSCAAPVVIRESLAAIADGDARLIEISKTSGAPRPGVRHFPMTCHSGGTLEIHIEPLLPTKQLVVLGRTPVARALAALGSVLGRYVVVAEPNVSAVDFPTADRITTELAHVNVDERTSIVIAMRGDTDEDAAEAALQTPASYIGLVASRTRGDVIRDMLARRGVAADQLGRLVYPAGLDMGHVSDEEIALSILAQILMHRHARESDRRSPAHHMFEPTSAPNEAVDPICDMTVAITPTALRAEFEGTTYYFCGESCRRRFLKDPAAALAASR
ncbi:MAG TPA: XdhC family protein [Candidatus Limnocylindria bacterium]|nr:XdhC family protein [Candidatus Limnocylindria bacterium]